MFTKLKRNARKLLILVIALAVCALSVGLFLNAEEVGKAVGSTAGSSVGKAVGSFEGVTKGLGAGYESGKAEGLSAEDTEAEVMTAVQELGNLRVLVANVDIPNYHELGKKYAALYLFRGSAVFSVDLTKAVITRSADGAVTVTLPEPTAKVSINDSETKLLAEYQAAFFNGSAEDGFEAYLNTLKAVDNIALEEVSNYENLLTMARDSAKKQVRRVTESVCVNCGTVTVEFRSEE